ncbi:conserved hypothetical protein [Clostridiaceae bacterium BL-3]|nr:hypothetical protein F3O63_06245 [Clostridium sp. HV4-5-A1G]CAB1242888.1 conserved hypothetical protein [Clostridiaceae bacterium BL-3]
MIYVVLIGCICIFISLGCYSMEMNIRSNNLKDYKKCLELDIIEKPREYLLTRLNRYIVENVSCKENNLKGSRCSLDNIKIYFEECYIYYDENIDCFKAEYIFNGKFYKEEIYEYELREGRFVCSCVDYSFSRECK